MYLNLKKNLRIIFFILVIIVCSSFTLFLFNILNFNKYSWDKKDISFYYRKYLIGTVDINGYKIAYCFVDNNEKYTVILLHGYAKSLKDILEKGLFFVNRYNLLFFDFPSHGNSSGYLTSFGWNEHKVAKKVLEQLKEKLQLNYIGIYGFSMGSVVAYLLSSNFKFCFAVIDSPFLSVDRVIENYTSNIFGFPRFFSIFPRFYWRIFWGFNEAKKFNLLNFTPKVKSLLLVSAVNDKRTPLKDVEKIYKFLKKDKNIKLLRYLKVKGDHNNHSIPFVEVEKFLNDSCKICNKEFTSK